MVAHPALASGDAVALTRFRTSSIEKRHSGCRDESSGTHQDTGSIVRANARLSQWSRRLAPHLGLATNRLSLEVISIYETKIVIN